jgi:hypothetical protein
MGKNRSERRILMGEREGKRSLGKHFINGWVILKRILNKIGLEGMNWISVAHGRDNWQAVVNTVLNVRVA